MGLYGPGDKKVSRIYRLPKKKFRLQGKFAPLPDLKTQR